jgi:hypothetical protein
MRLIKEDNGITTLEFAITFPIIFFICFFCILLLFRIGDGMILQYEASRLSRLESTGITLEKTDPYYNDLVEIPSLNLFEKKEIFNSQTESGNPILITTDIVASEAKMPPLLTSLSLINLGGGSYNDYTILHSSSIRVKEPYLPGAE